MKLTKSFIGAALVCCAVMTGCSENKLTLSESLLFVVSIFYDEVCNACRNLNW